jgi:hypothetical protein
MKKFFGLFLLLFLITVSPALASTFSFSPSSGSYNQNCQSAVDIVLSTGTSETNAADIIIDYDPAKIEIVDSDVGQTGVQIKGGSVYSNYFGNVVDEVNGVIRLTGATFSGYFSGSGVFATIQFKPKLAGITADFSIRFTGAGPYITLDSNIADAYISNDTLTSVTNGSYSFLSGSCTTDTTPPTITFVTPTNGQTGVASTANIVIKVSDLGSGVDLNNVEIIINGISYQASDPQVTTTGSPAEYTFTVQPIDPLSTTQTNTLVVKAYDLSGNYKQSGIAFNSPVSPTSTPQATCPTLAPTAIPDIKVDHNSPTITFVSPKKNDTISLNPTIIIKVADLESGIDPETLKIEIGTVIYNRNSPELSLTQNDTGYTATLKIKNKLDPGANYVLTAFVADTTGNGLSQSIAIHTKKTATTTVSSFPFIPVLIFLALIPLLFFLYRRFPITFNTHGIPIGITYNSQTHEPISGVKIDIFDEHDQFIKTLRSNIFGIFYDILPDNNYRFIAAHPDFKFPSEIDYKKLNFPKPYFGQIIKYTKTPNTYLNLPLDPVKSNFPRLYPRGTVTDSSGKAATGFQLGLIETKFNSLVSFRITDQLGGYRFIVPNGRYEITDLKHQHRVLLTVDTRHKTSGFTVINQNLIISS